MPKGRLAATRRRLYAILEQDSATGRLSLLVSYGLIALIVLTLIATVLESIPALNDAYRSSFYLIELVAVSVFSVEYAARAWTAYEHAPWRRFGPVGSRLRYLGSAWGLIDLVGILPVWLAIFMAPELKTLLVLRLLRFLKLTRYSPAMRSLLDALYAERRALAGCFVILLGTALMAAALMHLAERSVQPDKFGTIRTRYGGRLSPLEQSVTATPCRSRPLGASSRV
jgi:voltage-gated potassium channel